MLSYPYAPPRREVRWFISTLEAVRDTNQAQTDMKTIISNIVNNNTVAATFFNLWERWQDEYRYEDIEDYGDAMTFAIRKGGLNCAQLKPTQRPFGVKVSYCGYILHFFVKRSGNHISLCCRTLVKPASLLTAKAVIKRDGEGLRIPWVYAHGKLEDDLKTDLFDVDLNGESVRDGLKALYKDKDGVKEVVFHLYRNDFGQLTGIATYADDEEAYAYGRKLVAEKPHIF